MPVILAPIKMCFLFNIFKISHIFFYLFPFFILCYNLFLLFFFHSLTNFQKYIISTYLFIQLTKYINIKYNIYPDTFIMFNKKYGINIVVDLKTGIYFYVVFFCSTYFCLIKRQLIRLVHI